MPRLLAGDGFDPDEFMPLVHEAVANEIDAGSAVEHQFDGSPRQSTIHSHAELTHPEMVR